MGLRHFPFSCALNYQVPFLCWPTKNAEHRKDKRDISLVIMPCAVRVDINMADQDPPRPGRHKYRVQILSGQQIGASYSGVG